MPASFQRLAYLFVFLLGALIAADASAGELHFYNVSTGETAVGSIVSPGAGLQFKQQPATVNFSGGWTHIVPASASRLVTYNANDGSGAVAQYGASAYQTLHSYPASTYTPGWTVLANAGKDRILFYNRKNGLAALTKLGASSGDVEMVKSYPNGHFGLIDVLTTPGGTLATRVGDWTHIVGTTFGVFFYDSTKGLGETGDFNASGDYRVIKNYGPKFSTGWTGIVNLPGDGDSNFLIYYNKANGLAAAARLNRMGEHETLADYKLAPGFTSVVAIDGMRVFLYNKVSGNATVLKFSTAGALDAQVPMNGTFSPGWSNVNFVQN